MVAKNIFSGVERRLPDEEFTSILTRPGIRLERIVSWGQSSPPDFWYDQDEDEWVLLLSGSARLSFLLPDETLELAAGDHLLIPAHRRHRVDWTDPDEATVWLAVFLPAGE